jgi:hypothetical protein
MNPKSATSGEATPSVPRCACGRRVWNFDSGTCGQCNPRRRTHHTYAFQCSECGHLASCHLWDPLHGGSLTEGPYRCACGCSQPQDGPFVGLTQRQYERSRDLLRPAER